MRGPSGSGTVIRDLGTITQVDLILEGVIGGANQPSTLLVLVDVASPAAISINRLPCLPFTDRFLSVGIRTADGSPVPLNERGQGVPIDVANTDEDESAKRLPAGGYVFVISTSQWQATNYRVQVKAQVLTTLRLPLHGSGGLAARIGIKRFRAALTGKGGLRLTLSRTIRLSANLSGRAVQRGGLMVIPSYKGGVTTSLSHAWVSDTGAIFAVGSGSGLVWKSVEYNPAIRDYSDSSLSLADFRQNPLRRLIFSGRAADVYASYPDIGPLSSQVETATSASYPNVSFIKLGNGTYQRSIRMSLPGGGDLQVLVWIDETLYWNNDVIRDTEVGADLVPRFVAISRQASSAHRRKVHTFIVSQSSCRLLRQPPSDLLALLEELLPPLDTYLRVERIRVPGGGAEPAWVEYLFPEFAVSSESPGEADRILGDDPAAFFGGLLAGYGLSRLLRAETGFASPAVFDLLEDSESIFTAPGYDRNSYSFVIAALKSRPDNLLQISPWFQDGSYRLYENSAEAYQSAGVITLRYAGWSAPLPASSVTGVSPADPRWTLVPDAAILSEARTNRFLQPTAFIAYDWGDAVGCQQKLKAIGFTALDPGVALVPAQPALTLNLGKKRPIGGTGGLGFSRIAARGTRSLKCVMTQSGLLSRSAVNQFFRARLTGRGGFAPCRLVTMKLPPLYSTLLGRGNFGRPVLSIAFGIRLTGKGGFGRCGLAAVRP